jgi:hypothetical protein
MLGGANINSVFFAIRLFAFAPVPICIALFVFTPGYTMPMIHSALGIAMLVLAGGFVAGAYALSSVAIKFLRTRRMAVGLLLYAVSVLFCTFPALWLVFLGPAVLTLIQKQPS